MKEIANPCVFSSAQQNRFYGSLNRIYGLSRFCTPVCFCGHAIVKGRSLLRSCLTKRPCASAIQYVHLRTCMCGKDLAPTTSASFLLGRFCGHLLASVSSHLRFPFRRCDYTSSCKSSAALQLQTSFWKLYEINPRHRDLNQTYQQVLKSHTNLVGPSNHLKQHQNTNHTPIQA